MISWPLVFLAVGPLVGAVQYWAGTVLPNALLVGLDEGVRAIPWRKEQRP